MQGDARKQPQHFRDVEIPTILVVDDEVTIRDLCARTLKGYFILQAENGQDALHVLDQNPVDLVLVDVMMPIMNGLELLQKIKERDPSQQVVIMTGYTDKDIIIRALKAQADDFIQKPINLLQLKTSIDKALEKKALRRELLHVKQLDRLKTDFLGLVSHKLRTPTTSISLFIQNLVNGITDQEDPEFRDALAAVSEESEYLAYLIQDLLHYSDILLHDRRKKVSREDLKEIMTSLILERRPALEQKGLTLDSTLPGVWPMLNIDRRRIAFALGALLDNAIKFTQRGGTINLSGDATDQGVTLVVSDNGPGVSAEEIPRVFEKFYQIDPQQTGQVRGFGLGLFYARQFVHDHDGTLSLESSPGKGTRVTLHLPMNL